MNSSSLLIPQQRNDKLRLILLVLFFVVGFHVAFQPFQMPFYDWETKVLVLSSYAGITLLVMVISQFLLPRWKPSWSKFILQLRFGRLLWILAHVIAIALGVFAFKVIGGFYPFSWARVGTGLIATAAIASIPAGIYLLWNWKQRQIQPAQNAPKTNEMISLTANRGGKALLLDPKDVLILEAQGNYTVITTVDQTHKLRASLSSIEAQLVPHPQFIRAHRAFIVNEQHCTELSRRNSTSFVKIRTHQIPVSREKITLFKSLLHSS